MKKGTRCDKVPGRFYEMHVMLSSGQTIATCQRNKSQHCWAQHVVCVLPPCCNVLQHVGCCWLKFENGQIWANNTQHVATRCNAVAKRTQHVAPNNFVICCVGMLRSFGRNLTWHVFRKTAQGLYHTWYLFHVELDQHLNEEEKRQVTRFCGLVSYNPRTHKWCYGKVI